MDKITNYMRVTKKRKAHEHEDLKKPATGESYGRAGKVTGKATSASPASTAASPPATASDADGLYVPEFIYATVKYARKGQGSRIDPTLRKVVAYIQEHYDVPKDFEQSHKFGPHSGLTFETRLTRAYSLRQLKPKTTKTKLKPICLSCATIGHIYKECPDGF